MLNIKIDILDIPPTFKRRFAIVERKGVGHPDTICDLVMEDISIELAKLYMKEVGYIMHYNLDKAMLVAGESENRFNGGIIIKPIRFIFGDRATSNNLPIKDIVEQRTERWFSNHLRFFKDEHIIYQFEIGKASRELQSIFTTKKHVANDTSALVGYAPFTKTEKAVLKTEEYINSKEFKREFPESGEDVKVMGFRDNNLLDLTIAIAFIDSYVDSERQYFVRKQEMLQAIEEFHKRKGYFDTKITINNLDRKGKGIDGLYLTVLGTSADSSDSGEVGRGNRSNGVISLMRPTGSEAMYGKNPTSHIGKIYNALAFKIADDIYQNLGLDEVFVWMYNAIGNPIDEPIVIVQTTDERSKKDISKIVEDNIINIDEFCKKLMYGYIRFI